MPELRVVVVDDEPLARARILELLEPHGDVTIVGEAGSGPEAVELIAGTAPDLAFLDVQMPELDGFGVLAALGPDRPPAVVFVTAYDRYALQAFEVHALDYLLKPFDRERFDAALDRVRAMRGRREAGEPDRRLAALLEEVTGRRHLTRIAVRHDGRVRLVRVAEVDWIEAASNYVRLHVGPQRYLLRETMSALETRLDPEQFVRIHRSTIVNLERVRELEPFFHGDWVVKLHDGRQLTLSRTYRERFEARLGRAL